MSLNNLVPAWMLGEYETAFLRMREKEIDVLEFAAIIHDLPTVPKFVKDNWAARALMESDDLPEELRDVGERDRTDVYAETDRTIPLAVE